MAVLFESKRLHHVVKPVVESHDTHGTKRGRHVWFVDIIHVQK